MYTSPLAVRTAVETTLRHNPNSPDAIQSTDVEIENDVLCIKLQLPSQFTSEDVTQAVQAGVMAYTGVIVPLIRQQMPLPVGQAAVDFVEDQESELTFRCEIPNQWIRDRVSGDLSLEELLYKPLSSIYLIDADGTPQSIEEAYKEVLREETDVNPEDVDLRALADKHSR